MRIWGLKFVSNVDLGFRVSECRVLCFRVAGFLVLRVYVGCRFWAFGVWSFRVWGRVVLLKSQLLVRTGGEEGPAGF